MLFITSFDCYCSVITFSKGELGTQLPESQLPPHLLSQSKVKESSAKLNDVVKDGHIEKKVSGLELKGTPSPSKTDSAPDPPQSNGKTPRRIRPTQLESFTSPETNAGSSCRSAKTPPCSSPGAPPITNTVAKTVNNSRDRGEGPRRVNFITLTKFSSDKEQGQSSSSSSSCSLERGDEEGQGKVVGEPMEIQTSE